MTLRKRLLVVDCAALGWNLAPRVQARLKGRVFQRMSGTFPALTCPVQAAFRTGAPAARHDDGLAARRRAAEVDAPELGRHGPRPARHAARCSTRPVTAATRRTRLIPAPAP